MDINLVKYLSEANIFTPQSAEVVAANQAAIDKRHAELFAKYATFHVGDRVKVIWHYADTAGTVEYFGPDAEGTITSMRDFNPNTFPITVSFRYYSEDLPEGLHDVFNVDELEKVS